MPEETNLTHVATTLQFCLEQLQLCKQTVSDTEEKQAYVCLMLASTYTGTALTILAHAGHVPAPLDLEPEGNPA